MPYKSIENRRLASKRYRAKNRDKLRIAYRKYYCENKEKELARCKSRTKTKNKFRNKVKASVYNKNWSLVNRDKRNAAEAKRRASRLQRTPKWLTPLDLDHIKMFYAAAHALTKELGINFEVDHIIPLQGKDISGLHVPWNLQVITEAENCSKGNRR